MIVSSLLGVGSALGLKPRKIFKPITGIFGGGSHVTPSKRKKEQQIRQDISTYLKSQDKRYLVSIAHSNIAPNAQAMAHFFVGEMIIITKMYPQAINDL